ncbi:MAG: hypothetical protein HQL25_02165 [Candidatus Omnitrophica bacterium]|nr:hypothetical protein [Candidatus Omnitrophota bacterium]
MNDMIKRSSSRIIIGRAALGSPMIYSGDNNIAAISKNMAISGRRTTNKNPHITAKIIIVIVGVEIAIE